MQAMCGATAAAQLVFALASIPLVGGWFWDEPSGYFLGHAGIAALLAVLVHRAREHRAALEAG